MHYVYANHDIRKSGFSFQPIMLLFYLPFFISAFGMIIGAVKPVSPLVKDYDASVYIVDRLEVMADKEEQNLLNSLEHFYDITGVAPVVITINNSNWSDSLQNFAYNEYLRLFCLQ